MLLVSAYFLPAINWCLIDHKLFMLRITAICLPTVAILKCDVLLSQTQNLDLNFKASITSFFCNFLPTMASNHTFMNYNGAAVHDHRLCTCEPWSLELLACSCVLIASGAKMTHSIKCVHHLMYAYFLTIVSDEHMGLLTRLYGIFFRGLTDLWHSFSLAEMDLLKSTNKSNPTVIRCNYRISLVRVSQDAGAVRGRIQLILLHFHTCIRIALLAIVAQTNVNSVLDCDKST